MLRPAVHAFRFAGFRLDLTGGTLWRGPGEVPLRRKAWQVLVLLVQPLAVTV